MQGPMNEEQKSKMIEIKQQCADELKLSPEDINKMKTGDITNLNPSHKVRTITIALIFVDTDTNEFVFDLQCFAKCIFEKTGIMTDGKINEAVAVEKISMFAGPEQAANIFNQCKNVGGADPCESALKLFECTNKNKH